MKERNTQSRTAYRSQLKEHKKLYKSGKNWMAATLLTVGLAGGAMLAGNTTANADALPAQSSQTAQTVTDNSELSQTQADAQKQQQTIDNGNAQLDKQNQQLSNLQGQQTTAQQNLDQAKQAQQQATAKDSAVQQAQQAVNQTQQQVNGQQTVVDQANTAVQKDEQAVQEAQTKANQATQNATTAINQVAEQQKQEAQSTVDDLENQAKTNANQELDSQINNVSSQVGDAQNDVNNTNSKISDLQGQVKDLQEQQDNAQKNSSVKNFDGHVVDTSKSLLENASRNNLWDNYYDNTQDDSIWNGNVIPQNIYVSPDNNKTEDHSSLGPTQPNLDYYNTLSKNVDVVNGQMTEAQKQELAILLMNEINHAREQRGLKPFTMTEQKYDQAQVRASQQSANGLNHSVSDMINAFGQDQYECLAYIPTNGGESMMGMLFNASDTVSNMLNADASSDWGHRENFLWDTGDLNYDAAFGFHYVPEENDYVLTFDFDGTAADDNNNTPNMMDRIANYATMGPTTGDSQIVDNSAKINDLNNQISNLQNTLNSQKSHLNDLQGQLQNLQAQKANVQFDLSQLTSDQQAEYNKAKDTLTHVDDWKSSQLANINSDSSVKAANDAVTSAKSILQQDLKNQTEAQQGLDSLKQELATKQSALDNAEQKANANANQAVKDAQAKLNTINGKISDLNNAIATTKATIKNAQILLAQDNKKIDELKNKPATKPSTGDKDSETIKPSTPAKGDDNKGSENPAQPSTPTTDKDDNKGSEIPAQPSQPAKSETGNKDHGTTPAKPSTPTKNDNKGGETPAQPAQPTKPDTGNASISGQAGHKPAKSDNGSQEAGNTATNKPTIVLPTTGSESATNAGSQGQYINVVSKDSVASQAGIQAPASMETTSVTFGTKTSEPMTREEYKAQQAKLPQTGDENGKAVIALGVLGGMFGLGLAVKSKKEF